MDMSMTSAEWISLGDLQFPANELLFGLDGKLYALTSWRNEGEKYRKHGIATWQPDEERWIPVAEQMENRAIRMFSVDGNGLVYIYTNPTSDNPSVLFQWDGSQWQDLGVQVNPSNGQRIHQLSIINMFYFQKEDETFVLANPWHSKFDQDMTHINQQVENGEITEEEAESQRTAVREQYDTKMESGLINKEVVCLTGSFQADGKQLTNGVYFQAAPNKWVSAISPSEADFTFPIQLIAPTSGKVVIAAFSNSDDLNGQGGVKIFAREAGTEEVRSFGSGESGLLQSVKLALDGDLGTLYIAGLFNGEMTLGEDHSEQFSTPQYYVAQLQENWEIIDQFAQLDDIHSLNIVNSNLLVFCHKQEIGNLIMGWSNDNVFTLGADIGRGIRTVTTDTSGVLYIGGRFGSPRMFAAKYKPGAPRNKLFISDPDVQAFGTAVAMSHDPQKLAISAFLNDDQPSPVIYTYTLNATTEAWEREVTPIRLPHADKYDNAQLSLAISDNGRRLVVGAPTVAHGENSQAGAVYVYDYDEGNQRWELKTTLLSPSPSRWFGNSVALSGNGRTLVVGAPGYNTKTGENEGFGAAYLFHQSSMSNEYSIVKALDSPDRIDPKYQNLQTEAFGNSVAVSADGSTVAVTHNNGVNLFMAKGNVSDGHGFWQQLSNLSVIDNSSNLFEIRSHQIAFEDGTVGGISIALSKNGHSLVTSPNSGHKSYLFHRASNNNWVPTADGEAVHNETNYDSGAVAVTPNYIFIGVSDESAEVEGIEQEEAGVVTMYSYWDGGLGSITQLHASDAAAYAYFGKALATNGRFLAVGSASKGSGSDGAVYIFDITELA